jgi:hypothetical protein
LGLRKREKTTVYLSSPLDDVRDARAGIAAGGDAGGERDEENCGADGQQQVAPPDHRR